MTEQQAARLLDTLAEKEKETLRQRGVIKSSTMRLPHGPLLSDGDRAELQQILRDLDLL